MRFIERTASLSAAAAAGAAVTAATANPVAGAAAGAATSKGAEELIGEFLSAQQEGLGVLLQRTHEMERLLGVVHSDIQTLLDARWRAALLHIEDAAKRPDRAPAELQLARNALYDAWGASNSAGKRAQIAQEISAVYALLGEYDNSRDWLYRSYPEACADVDDAVDHVIASFPELPKVKSRVKDQVHTASIPEGVVAIFQETPPRPYAFAGGSHPTGTRLVRCVRPEPLQSALTALAEAKLAVVGLRSACLATDSRGVDAYEIPSRVTAEIPYQVTARREMMRAQRWLSLKPSPSTGWDTYIVGGPDARTFAPTAVLEHIWTWRVTVIDVPIKRGTKVFVSGSIPEFGGWRQDRALPLIKTEPGRWYHWHTQPSRPVEYAYFIVTRGAKPIWEPGPRRTLTHLDGIERVDRWRRKGKAQRGKPDAPLPPAFLEDGPDG